MRDYHSDSRKLQEYKKSNDWKKSLELYDLIKENGAIFGTLPSNIPVKNSNEVLFAAKHYSDGLSKKYESKKTKENAEVLIDSYIWAWDNAAEFNNRIEDIELLKLYAYNNYDIYINTGASIEKIRKKHNIENCAQKIREYRKDAYIEAYESYKKINSIKPDTKQLYRLGRLLQKYFKSDWKNRNKEQKRQIYSEAREAFEKAIKVYDDLNGPIAMQNEYIKAKYRLCALLNDEFCDGTLNYEKSIKYMKTEGKFYLNNPTRWNGITWTYEEIKLTRFLLSQIRDSMHLPKDITDNNIEAVATIQEPVLLPVYIYYRQAKIYYAQYLFYRGCGKEAYDVLRKNRDEYYSRMNAYYEMAVKNCIYAISVRSLRKSRGFLDAGGIHPESNLLAILYSMNKNANLNAFEKLAKENWTDNSIKLYYAVNILYNDNGTDIDKAIKILEELSNGKDNTVNNRTKYILNLIRNGEI